MCKVEISNERYEELIKKEERLSVVERLIERTEYPTMSDVEAILNIKKKTVIKNETL